ncbi:MAG: hypothetical protein ACLFRT_14205, partial [Actinomycetota bacterium]
AGELRRVTAEVSPLLEISEITDRVSKSPAARASDHAPAFDPRHAELGGHALLFENVQGADVPLLINAFGSYRRMEMALGCEASDRPQFTSVQRTFLDIAVFGPFLVGASAAGALLGRSPSAVLAWGILIAPATLIMTNRKHEERLLGAYRHQVAWVHLHEAKIREILLGKAGFGDLEGPPRSARNLGKASPT